MKKYFAFVPALLFSIAAVAQTITPDPSFKVGKLENGLTYYLYHNEATKGCAEFYIAHNVGALQEDDNQNGLAHFLEHMAFNGTKHYPEKGILEFLAGEGVRFGYNVNAYTSRTETVYNISAVPLVRESFVDSVLMVLHDWSCDISCEQKALDDERGVISEEWRLRDEPRYRMMCRQNDLIYKGSKQPDRTVLGTMEVINGFKREEILDFYHKWYRPDLQAIILVGDFDVDYMEGRVQALFSDIPASVNPTPKETYMPPVLTEPLFESQTDHQIKYQAMKVIYKQPYPAREERATEGFYKDFMCRSVITSIVSERLRERIRDRKCPAQSAVLVTSAYSTDYYVSLFTISPRERTGLAECLGIAQTEVERLLKFGVSEQELAIAKMNIRQRMHLSADQEDSNADIVKCALGNFLTGSALQSPTALRELQARVLSEITLADLADYPARMFTESEVIYSPCYNYKTDSDIVPSAEEMKSVLASVKASEIKPAFIEYPSIDLNVNVEAGSIVKSKDVKADTRLWTLSNGAKVYFKHTEKAKGGKSIVAKYYFETGYRALDQEKVAASRHSLSYIKRYAGARGCTATDLHNQPSLSDVDVTAGCDDNGARMTMLSGRNQAENGFALMYLKLSEPYFGNGKQLTKFNNDNLKSLSKPKDARQEFNRRTSETLYGNHPWQARIDSSAVLAANNEFVADVYARCYSDFSNMTIYIVSELDEEQVKDYVCKYIASLNAPYSYTLAKSNPIVPVKNKTIRMSEVQPPVSAPVTSIDYEFIAPFKADPKTLTEIKILDYIMSARYLALIREERGGAYHVAFTTEVPADPKRPLQSAVSFQTRPEMRDILINDIEEEMDRMCKNGPTASEMDLAVKYMIKRHHEMEVRHEGALSFMIDEMIEELRWGRDNDFDYEAVINSITAKDIKKLARRIAGDRRFIAVYTEE